MRSSSRTLFLLILTAAIAGGFFWITSRDPGSFYESSLRAAQARETVQLGNRSYSVEAGKVFSGTGQQIPNSEASEQLRLAYAKTVVRRNPAMSLAGVDVERLDFFIDDLTATAEALAALQTTPVEKTAVSDVLYPIDMLRAMADLEQKRRIFLEEGDIASWGAYDTALASAMDTYESSLVSFRDVFETIVGDSAQPYAAADSIVTRDGIVATVEDMLAGLKATRTESERIRTCAEGTVSSCDAQDLTLPVPGIPQKAALTREESDMIAYARELWAQGTGHKELNTGPIYVISNARCFHTDSRPAVYELYEFPDDPHRPPNLLILNDTQFIESSRFPDVPFFAFFSGKGGQYVPSVPTSHYKCMHVAEDQSRVFLMEKVRRLAEEYPLSAYAPGAQAEDFARLESIFTGNGVMTDSDTLTYLSLARSLILENSNIKEDLEHAISTLLVEASNGTSGFEDTIGNVAWSEGKNTVLEKKGLVVELSAPTLFYLRNGLLAVYLSGNRSIIPRRIDAFAVNNVPKNKQPFVYLSDLPQGGATRNLLLRDIRYYFLTHSKPESIGTIER